MTEAMGMSLPGCAAIPAVDAGKLRIARETGEAIIPLVKKQIKPRDIITKESLHNAIRVDMALGGSTNTVLHLMAIAVEAEVPLSLQDFNTLAEAVPHICHMQPSGPHSMQTLYRAGGIPAVLKRLEKHLDDCPTVSGKKILQIAEDTNVKNELVIRSPGSDKSCRRVKDSFWLSCTRWCCCEMCCSTKRYVETYGTGTGL